MTDQPTTISDRRAADVGPTYEADEFLIEDFVAAMLYSQRDHRRSVELVVHPAQIGELLRPVGADDIKPGEGVSIYLFVTYVRQIWPEVEAGYELQPYYRYPEFEVEGYLVDPPGRTGKFWVRLALLTTDDRRLTEATIYLLEPGEELGTARTQGVVG